MCKKVVHKAMSYWKHSSTKQLEMRVLGKGADHCIPQESGAGALCEVDTGEASQVLDCYRGSMQKPVRGTTLPVLLLKKVDTMPRAKG